MKVLIACEESQAVCIEFRKLGHEAFSCDLQECSGGHPEWHFQEDVFKVISGGQWDMMIAHPPCTYLTVTANKWYKDQPPRKSGALVGHERREARKEAIEFFMKMVNCGINKIAIENPIGVISSVYRKPDQIIQPWEYGHKESKSTCLWLKNLPLLKPTDIVEPVYMIAAGKRYSPTHYNPRRSLNHLDQLSPHPDRSKIRSKTYHGIAQAMADQWGGVTKTAIWVQKQLF